MKKILVIEDNKQYRNLLKIALEGEGYEVETAENGKIGLEKVGIGEADLILLDLLMPGMDGITFYNSLTNRLKKHIPIIVLTNVTDADGYGPNIKSVLIKANVSIDEVLVEVKKYI
jgi:two-component system, OmpR family, alkaline phosphatase synthesis response regulator PhoP